MSLIVQGGIIRTPYGIQSLARNDTAFQKNENYWTGPIWINYNYMMLMGLKLNYYERSDVVDTYFTLREDVLTNMNKQF